MSPISVQQSTFELERQTLITDAHNKPAAAATGTKVSEKRFQHFVESEP